MCVCVCVSVCVSVCICVSLFTPAPTHIHKHTHTHTLIHTCLGLLRHETDVGHVAHGGGVEGTVLPAVENDLSIHIHVFLCVYIYVCKYALRPNSTTHTIYYVLTYTFIYIYM